MLRLPRARMLCLYNARILGNAALLQVPAPSILLPRACDINDSTHGVTGQLRFVRITVADICVKSSLQQVSESIQCYYFNSLISDCGVQT